MQHLGDICKINGAKITPVDIIIGGSPCQDLSSAGTKAGLAGERSGLFMEQIRIIKEMRTADEARGRTTQFIRPRFMVWENVQGAFSTNRGEDFRTVLEETAKIVQPDAVIPRPAGGKWRTSGCILGRGWSIAWRLLDAQFWGVPQCRRRIALVADFGGGAGPEILFERQSLLGDIEPGGAQGQAVASGAGGGAAQTGRPIAAGFNYRTGAKAGNIGYALDRVPTLRAESQVAVLGFDLNQITWPTNRSTLRDVQPALCGSGQAGVIIRQTDQSRVRRLTPLEWERLQGFPDGWTDIDAWHDSKGKLHKESSDSARYRALGNSIALPPWRWVLLRLAAQYYRPATLGSLFDGIGGFPLIWEQINGQGSCLWASEVDEFCMAVTKRRFKEVLKDE